MSLPRLWPAVPDETIVVLVECSWAINTEKICVGPSIRAIVSSPTTSNPHRDGTDSGIKPEEIRHEYDRTMPGEVWDLLLKSDDMCIEAVYDPINGDL